MKLSSNATIRFLLLATLSLSLEGRLGGNTGKNNNGSQGSRASGVFRAGMSPSGRRVLQALEGFGSNPPDDVRPLQLCQGDCDSDDDCDEGLICFQRNAGIPIPGCVDGENEMSNSDYCIVSPSDEVPSSTPTPIPTMSQTSQPPAQPSVAPVAFDEDAAVQPPDIEFVGNGEELVAKLQECEADCDIDEDCEDGLVCYQREKDQPIPGCLGVDASRNDYCIVLPMEGSTSAPSLSSPIVGTATPSLASDAGPSTSSPTVSIEAISTGAPSSGEEEEVDLVISMSPTMTGTPSPTELPTNIPSVSPTMAPTGSIATGSPTGSRTSAPTGSPTGTPTGIPTESPTGAPTGTPTDSSTGAGTPTGTMTVSSTVSQTTSPTALPTTEIIDDYNATEVNDTNVTEVNDSNMTDVGFEEEDDMPEAVLVGNNNDPAFFPLQKCQGDCDTNDECAENLICFQRRNDESIPGCATPDSVLYGIDFCVDPKDLETVEPTAAPPLLIMQAGPVSNTTEAPSAAPVTSSPTPALSTVERTMAPSTPSPTSAPSVAPSMGSPTARIPEALPLLQFSSNNSPGALEECQGDCDYDEDCLPGLMCHQRNGRDPVPGCSSLTTGVYGADYCTKEQNANPTASPTSTNIPTNSPTTATTMMASEAQTMFDTMDGSA